jgi:DNA-binding NtrC family response regulator
MDAPPVAMSGNEIPHFATHAPLAPAQSPGTLPLLTPDGEVRPIEDIEAEVIRFAITHYRGQMSEVARRLRIGRSTLYRKLETLDATEHPEPEDR